jgi:recombinational DNA repair ATPase RecF
MIRVRRLKLVNFFVIKKCLGKDSFELNIDNDLPLTIFLGANGSGKTSILQELSPSPLEHTLYRTSSRIIEGKSGLKELDLEYNDEFLYKCKIEYNTKTSCFLTKKDLKNGKEIELNPNGNVQSYYEVLEKELGFVKQYINVGFLSNTTLSILNMKASPRSEYITVWLPQLTDFIDSYKLGLKKYNLLKKQIELLNNDIGKLIGTDYELMIENYTNSINELENKYSEYNGFLAKNNTYLSLLPFNSKEDIEDLVNIFKE